MRIEKRKICWDLWTLSESDPVRSALGLLVLKLPPMRHQHFEQWAEHTITGELHEL